MKAKAKVKTAEKKAASRPPKEMIEFLRKLEMMEMLVDLNLDEKMPAPKAKK